MNANTGALSCPSEDAIVDYVDGGLAGHDRRAICAHLDVCPRCQAAAIELAVSLDDGPGADALPTGVSALPVLQGRYALEEIVGAGGNGVVYAARDTRLDRLVAVKRIRLAVEGDGAELRARRTERLRREARALARLKHPHVVEVFDIGVGTGGEVFIVMQYLRGGTLRQRLPQLSSSLPDTLALMDEAAQALEAAHGQGIVHRDFKPDNVMFDDAGALRVVDFGLARTAAPAGEALRTAPATARGADRLAVSLTETDVVLGSPPYMAPEQFGGAEADERADQYAFFVTMFEALCGHRPFVGDGPAALRDAKARGQMVTGQRWQHTPAWLRRVIVRGLDPDPERRWPSMRAVRRRLGSAGGGTRRVRAPIVIALLGVGILGVVGTRVGARASASLPPVDDPVAASEGLPSVVADDAARARRLDEALDRARALADGGALGPALQIAQRTATEAEAAGLPRLAGTARLLEGLLADARDEADRARRSLSLAFTTLEILEPAKAVEAAVALVGIEARAGDGASARRWQRRAQAALTRGGDHGEHSYDLALGRAAIAEMAGASEAALAAHRRCLALARSDRERGVAATNVANVLAALSRHAEATDAYTVALQSHLADSGPDHVATIAAGINLAGAHMERDAPDDALRVLDAFAPPGNRTAPPSHRAAAGTIRAVAAGRRGDDRAALAAYEAVLAIEEEADAGAATVATTLLNLATVHERRGECARAERRVARARTLLESEALTDADVYQRALAAAASRCPGTDE